GPSCGTRACSPRPPRSESLRANGARKGDEMSPEIQLRVALARKVALVTLLVAAGMAGHRIYNSATGFEQFALGLLLFGIANVLLSAPGTKWVRAIAIGVTVVALLWPAANLLLVAIIAWLVWCPAFMVAWALARQSNSTPREPTDS